MMARSPLLFLLAVVTLAAAAVAIVSGAASAATSVPGGNVTSPTSWTAAGSPYLVDGTLTIDPGASITIDAGVEVDINLTATIEVRGSLNATGTAASPVIFDWQGTPGGPFGGLRLLGVSAPSTLSNLTLRHAGRALYATAAAASVTFFDLRVENATVRAIEIENTARSLRIVRLSIVDTYDGILLTNVANLTFEGVSAGRFTYSGAWAVYGNTVQRTTFTDFVSVEGEVRLAGATEVAFWGLWVVGPEENWPLMVYGGATLRVDRFVRTGSYSLGPFIQNVGGLWFSNFTVTGTLYSPYAESMHLEGSPGARFTDGVLDHGNCGLCLSTSGLTEIRNVSVSDGTTGVSLVRSGSSIVDGLRVANMTSFGVYMEFSDGTSIAHTSVVNASLPFRVGAHGGITVVDVSVGNSVDGVPVLGIVNSPNQTVSGVGYSWIYILNSPNTTVTGANMTRAVSDVSVAVLNSPGTILRGITAVGGTVLYVQNSADTLVEGSNLTGDEAIWDYFNQRLTVRNSTLSGTGYSNTVGGFAADSALFEDDQITNLGTAVRLAGSGATYRRVNISGLRAFDMGFFGASVLEDSTVCGKVLLGGSDAVVRNITMCPGNALGFDIAGARATVENVAFDGQAPAILLSGAAAAVLRWNTFRNCTGNSIEVKASPASSALVYENAVYCGAQSAADHTASNITWYNAARLHGNYWAGYSGGDSNGDFIGDAPQPITGASRSDLYPLVAPIDLIPPVARVPGPFTADADWPITLDGSASSDNVAIVNATWWVNETGTPTALYGLSPTYTFASTGTFEARLVVRDAWANEAVASVWITVVDTIGPRWEVPTVAPIASGGQVSFSVENAVDQAGVVGVSWKVAGSEVSTAATFSSVFFAIRNHTVMVELTDGLGHVATYNVTVRVVDDRPPVLGPGSFASSRVAYQNEPIELRAANAFVDNDPAFASTVTYAWSTAALDAAFTGPTNASSATVAFANLGDFSVVVRVSDASGNYVDIAIPIHVIDGTPPGDLAWSVEPNGTVQLGLPVHVSAGATDPSGVSFHWDFGDGTSGDGPSLDHTYTRAGQFRINLTVSDGVGNRLNATVLIKVQAPPAPAASPAGDTSVLVAAVGAAAGAAALAGVLLMKRRKGTAPQVAQPQVEQGPVVVEAPQSEYDRLYGGQDEQRRG